jgi:DNA-binding NtrC family response regulator
MATILYVDDEPTVGLILEDTLQRAGHRALGARNVPEALQILAGGEVELIISDYRMPGISGLEFVEMLKREGHDVPLIMITGYASIEHAVSAIKAGAIDYITKPVQPAQLELAVAQALEVSRLRAENDQLRREVMEFRNERQIIGDSPVIRQLLQAIATVAPTRATVLIEGESGTGKELVAHAIHDRSDRRDQPFVNLNCAALPEGLIESALFGHERGAFTGAVRRVAGAFERAHRGTLLLDEISEMRLDIQAKLLRVLQEQEFERLGGTTPVRVDVRIIATTNRNLAAAVSRGEFRQDLYYRLSVMPLVIAPLRERPSDIALLATRFAKRTAAEIGKEVRGIAPDALALLQQHDWPGNVRELQHAVERGVILANEPVLPARVFDVARSPGAVPAPPRTGATLGDVPDGAVHTIEVPSLRVAEVERVLIQRALLASGQNRTRAAELLGISVRTLRNKLNVRMETAEQGAGDDA